MDFRRDFRAVQDRILRDVDNPSNYHQRIRQIGSISVPNRLVICFRDKIKELLRMTCVDKEVSGRVRGMFKVFFA